jgi:hypothetical protein
MDLLRKLMLGSGANSVSSMEFFFFIFSFGPLKDNHIFQACFHIENSSEFKMQQVGEAAENEISR